MGKSQSICIVKYCRKEKKDGNYCHSCKKKKYIDKDPVRYAFDVLKLNAKRRNKKVEITLDQFRKFCIETDYIRKRGRTKKGYSIDRIDNNKGYTIDNIRMIKHVDNIKKGTKKMVLKYDYQTGNAKYIEIKKANNEAPF